MIATLADHGQDDTSIPRKAERQDKMNARPNLLILHADQLRYDGLGCDGNPAGCNLTIYDDRFRLTWWPTCGTVELFDHHDDPDEVRDLGGSGHPDEERLLAELKERQLRVDNPMLGKVGAW